MKFNFIINVKTVPPIFLIKLRKNHLLKNYLKLRIKLKFLQANKLFFWEN